MTRSVRRLAALMSLAASTTCAVLLLWPAHVQAQEPDVTAWWNAANAGDPAPAPPVPPDVASDDLLVQGSNTGPGATPAGAAPASAQAVAGLAFDLGPTDLVGALTLTIDGDPPPQVTVVACKATQRFTSAYNGAWSRVPAYDASACVPGKLKDAQVVFADVSTLVTDARLAVVVLPGSVDRVVFKHPDDGALDVTSAGSIGGSAPAFGTGAGPGASAPPPALASGSSPSGGVAPPPVSGDAGLPGAATSGASGASPVLAAGQPPAATGRQMTPVAASSGLSTAQRRGLALAVIALEVVAFALLMRSPEGASLPVVAGAAAASGRLRAPDRWNGDGGAATVVGGVGRFRRERRGAAPNV